jgi:hypothetical protein
MTDPLLFVDRHVQIGARDAHIGVPGRVPDLSQRPSAGQGVAYKRVAPVVNRQRLEPRSAQDPAGRAEPLPQRVARERFDDATRNQRRQERLVVLGAGA